MKRGIKIGSYQLAELLNTGGMGQVWLAHREFQGGGQTAVAIKFPHAAGVLDPRIREGLLDEARLQMRLQHPNIPRVTDMGVHEGLPYFVMDYIAGRSLAQVLTRMRDVGTPLRFEIIAHVAREIGYALRYAHTFQMSGVSQQVIHRDVAPKNTLISGQGGVYVVDFGVSEAVGMESSRNHVKGTLLYMAPEHAMGFPSPKSDGWGLGAILWEMIEGRQFRGEIEGDDLRRAANDGRFAPLAREGIPDALRFVTEGLLRSDERDRLTFDEVLTPLETAEFPAQRMALCELMKRRFGGSVHRSGQTLHDFKMPEQLDRTIAAARVIKDAGPFGLDSWADEAFANAGAPAVVAVSGTRPIPRAVALDDDDESAPREVARPSRDGGAIAEPVTDEGSAISMEPRARVGRAAEQERPMRTEYLPRSMESPSQPAHPRTETIPPLPSAPVGPRDVDAPVPRPRGKTQRSSGAVVVARPSSTPAPLAASPAPRSEPSTEVFELEPPRPGPAAPEPGAPQAVVAHESWPDAALHREPPSSAPMLMSAPVSHASRPLHPLATEPEGRDWVAYAVLIVFMLTGAIGTWLLWPQVSGHEESPMSASADDVQAAESEAISPAVPMLEVGTPLAVEPEPEPEPELDAKSPLGPGAEPPELAAKLEPGADSEPQLDPSELASERSGSAAESKAPKAGPKKATARAKTGRSQLVIMLQSTPAMTIEIEGTERSLTTQHPADKVQVTPGKILVRWRPPGGTWKERVVVIESGVDYKAVLSTSGLALEPAKRK